MQHIAHMLTGHGDPGSVWAYSGGHTTGTSIVDMGDGASVQIATPYIDKAIVMGIIRSLAGLTSSVSGHTAVPKTEKPIVRHNGSSAVMASLSARKVTLPEPDIICGLCAVDIPLLLGTFDNAMRAIQAAVQRGRNRLEIMEQNAADALIASRLAEIDSAIETAPLIPYARGQRFLKYNMTVDRAFSGETCSLYSNGVITASYVLLDLWKSGELSPLVVDRLGPAGVNDRRYQPFIDMANAIQPAVPDTVFIAKQATELTTAPAYRNPLEDFGRIGKHIDDVLFAEAGGYEAAIMASVVTGGATENFDRGEIQKRVAYVDRLGIDPTKVSTTGVFNPTSMYHMLASLYLWGYVTPPGPGMHPKLVQEYARLREVRGLFRQGKHSAISVTESGTLYADKASPAWQGYRGGGAVIFGSEAPVPENPSPFFNEMAGFVHREERPLNKLITAADLAFL